MVETFWFMMTVPAGAPRSLPMRAAARSTSGSHSSQAVIERRAQSSATSASAALALAGIAPSECEIMCTHPSSDGNSLRHSRSLSVVAMVASLLEHALRPLREDLVAHVPERGEEPLLHAPLEELRGLAFQRRRPGADDAIDQHEVPLAPRLEELVEVEERLGEPVERGVLLVRLVDGAQAHPGAAEGPLERGPHGLARNPQERAESRRFLARSVTEHGADRHVVLGRHRIEEVELDEEEPLDAVDSPEEVRRLADVALIE